MNENNTNQKLKVAVLFGGRSVEHEVSLKSAVNVIANIDQSLFEVIPIAIDKQGNWYRYDYNDENPSQLKKSQHIWFSPFWVKESKQTTVNKLDSMVDVIFPAVHGTFCEDGTLQGLLELADIPYVGCGVLASAIGMDKDIAKKLASLAGVPVGPYDVLKLTDWENNDADCFKKIISHIHYPVFVKPANTGSSVGIVKAKSETELKSAIINAFKYDNKILVERALDVVELEVAVLESPTSTLNPIVSVVGEITPSHEFYSYDAKYLDPNGAKLHIPANVSEKIKEEAKALAKQIFLALECEGMARIDLFLEKNTNKIYFNELNTLPGFTEISMYPQLMAASGIAYKELLTRLIQLAIKRFKQKNKLIRSYDELKQAQKNEKQEVTT